MSKARDHTTPLPAGTHCEGCGEVIRKGESRYCIVFGNYGEVLDVHTGLVSYYHIRCLDPYLIQLWLATWEAILISLSPSNL